MQSGMQCRWVRVEWTPILLTAVALIGVTACGGGGGGGSAPAPVPVPAPVVNSSPVANAGPDRTVNELVPVTLTGVATDSDGVVSSVVWSQVSGIAVVISDAGSLAMSFSAPAVEATELLTFRLTVTDNQGAVASDTVVVTVLAIFKDASTFAAMCVSPRSGIDPQTDLPFRDILGTRKDENNWLRSWSNDLYLWYDEITDRNPERYSTPEYFSLMKTFATTSTGTPKDQFHFSQSTEEFHEQSQGGIFADYGATFAILSALPPRKIVVAYTEPDSPATRAPASLARGAEIISIDGANVIDGSATVLNQGLFPATLGETHAFVVGDLGASQTRAFSMTSATVTSASVQHVRVLDTATGRIGYLLFNDHFATAERQLIDAFAALKAAGVSDLVLDLRYNSGGYLAIASEVAFMIAGRVATSGQAFEETKFNSKHTVFDPVTGYLLEPLPFLDIAIGLSAPIGTPLPSLNLNRVYVLTGGATCSASESIINSLLGIDVAVIQIGSTTCGKPYGFYPEDNCGTTYFSIQFSGVNNKGFGDYTDGFSPAGNGVVGNAVLPGCRVADDFTHAFGDPNEGRLAAALTYRASQTCPALSGSSSRALLTPDADLSAVDGTIHKPLWLQNRILQR
jgi:carboxyl-terminal processing protease